MAEESTSREVDVLEMVRRRADDIALLMAATHAYDPMGAQSGVVPRTCVQRLPRHLRRRAMSHNVKRMPLHARRYHSQPRRSTKERPPQPYYRRRAAQLLKSYIARQREKRWLETHIWHAKRMHMRRRWGHVLAETTAQRSFRASCRDAVRHTVVQDISYKCCVQVQRVFAEHAAPLSNEQLSDQQRIMIASLNRLCSARVGRSFAAKETLDGRCVGRLVVYEEGKYPDGCIGPVTFQWVNQCTIWVWTHPSITSAVMQQLSNVFSLVIDPSSTSSSPSSSRCLDDHIRRTAFDAKPAHRSADGRYVMSSLQGQMNVFRLSGATAIDTLHVVLRAVDTTRAIVAEAPAPDRDLNWSRTFERRSEELGAQTRNWSSLRGSSLGELTPNAVFSLLVHDPRFTRQRAKTVPSPPPRAPSVDLSDRPNYSPLHTKEMREAISRCKTRDHIVHKCTTDGGGGGGGRGHILPTMLLVAGDRRSIDLVLPCAYAMPFWIALQYSTARCVGQSHDRHMALEHGTPVFPYDAVDTHAGREEQRIISTANEELHDRRPPNRRPTYAHTPHPFVAPWTRLVADWSDTPVDAVYILRDLRHLMAIGRWLEGGTDDIDHILETHSRALLPIVLRATGRGIPRRMAMVCWVKDAHVLTEKGEDEEESTDDEPHIVHLDTLFADKQDLRQRQKALRARRSRLRYKANVKRRRTTVERDVRSIEGEEEEKDNLRTVCRQPIVGFCVAGDYSMRTGVGTALAYVSVASLRCMSVSPSAPRRLCYRNPASLRYRQCTTTVGPP